TRVLLHLVSAREDDPGAAYRVVRGELAAYGAGLSDKPEIVALSQIDILDPAALRDKAEALEAAAGRRPLTCSAATGKGMEAVLRALAAALGTVREAAR